MKKLFFLFLISPSIFAFEPPVTIGEAKIMYPCEAESKFSKKKEEREVVTFFDQEGLLLFKKGLILRRRTSNDSSDFTVKFRPTEGKLNLDKGIYQKLSKADGELKCESDITYSETTPKSSSSCSFKSKKKEMNQNHLDFIQMVGVQVNLNNLKQVQVSSTSWKIDAPEGPLLKSATLERWKFNLECLLELSGRFEMKSNENLESVFQYLKSLATAIPSEKQGNKTQRVLEHL